MIKIKELEALGLTKPRAEFLVTASRNKDGRCVVFGLQDSFRNALKESGYIARFPALEESRIAEMLCERDLLIADARDVIGSDWQLALGKLKSAKRLDEDAARTEYRLSEKGWEFVGQYQA